MRLRALALVLSLAAAGSAAAEPSAPDLRRPLAGCGRASDHLRQLANLEQALAQAPQSRFQLVRAALRRVVERQRKRLHECLPFNQIQVIGSHNSYHLRPREPFFTALAAAIPEAGLAWDYRHLPLDQQLGAQGVRQIELDVFTDPRGGLYARRVGPTLFGLPAGSGVPELNEPGFKVLHLQDLDFETSCFTLRSCLATVVAWSDAHPRHLPILILIELQDDPFAPELGFAVPIPFDPEALDSLDAEIRDVVPRRKLVVPDDVRGQRETLDEAVRRDGWPALGRLRGKLLFAMDNDGAKRELYTAGRPSAEGRVLFPNAVEGAPGAAFIKLNDPIGDFDRIRTAVAAGYLVRTRADVDTIEARRGDTGPREAALASGAQFVSTDYPEPDPRFGTGYEVSFPGGTPARCNPVIAPRGCSAELLE